MIEDCLMKATRTWLLGAVGFAMIMVACGKPPEPLSCDDDQFIYSACTSECVDLPASCVGLADADQCTCLATACNAEACSDQQIEAVTQLQLDGTCDATGNEVIVLAQIIDDC
jgi:hypothetical protein